MRVALLLTGWATVLATAAAATPPPPPPLETRAGPANICTARYALVVTAGETAERRGPDWWSLTTSIGELGVRSDGPPRDRVATPFRPEDNRRGWVMTVREYPGDRRWGWWYWLGDEDTPLFVAATGNGAAAANPLLDRILEGLARDRACAAAQ